MPVREMTSQEVKDWLGNGIVMPGPRRLSPSTVIKSELTDQKSGNALSPDTSQLTSDITEQVTSPSKKE